MPEFLAVQCFQCNQFQVSQLRKDKKFSCKLCGAKQSVRRIFGRSGAAKDVRAFVQARNLAQGSAAEAFDDDAALLAADNYGFDDEGLLPADYEHGEAPLDASEEPAESKWTSFTTMVGPNTGKTRQAGPTSNNVEFVDEDDVEDIFVTCLPEKGEERRKGGKARQQRPKPTRRDVANHNIENDARGINKSRSRQQTNTATFDGKNIKGAAARAKPRGSSAPAHGSEDDDGFILAAPRGDEVVEDEIVF